MKLKVKGIFAFLIACCSFPFAAHAGSFQINEQDAGLVGTALAGSTVFGTTSSVYLNPAEMVFVDGPQFSASSVAIIPRAKFEPTVATNAAGQNILGSSDANSPSRHGIIPGLYAIYPVNPQFAVGIGTAVPFGLSTQYDELSAARYFATQSGIVTMDITPSIAIKPVEHFAIGFGLDIMYAKATLDQGVDAQHLFYGFDPVNGVVPLFNGDLFVENKASGWVPGWHMGLFWQATPRTDVGFAYHSQMRAALEGNRRIIGLENALYPGAEAVPAVVAGLANSSVQAPLTLPDYGTISIKQKLNPWWDVLADISYVHWSVLKNITLNYGPQYQNVTATLDYRDTWRVSLGQEFKVQPRWKIRMGVAYDQTPTVDTHRDARLADGDRIWFSTGFNYKYSNKIDVDFSYAHILFEKSPVNQSVNFAPIGGVQSLVANYKTNANLLGLQLNYHFNAQAGLF